MHKMSQYKQKVEKFIFLDSLFHFRKRQSYLFDDIVSLTHINFLLTWNTLCKSLNFHKHTYYALFFVEDPLPQF